MSGLEDAPGVAVTAEAIATGVNVGIGLAVGVWPGARVCLGDDSGDELGGTIGRMDAAATAGAPTPIPPGAAGSVARAGAQDATARANAAAPATEAIILRLITDRPPAWTTRCWARDSFMIANPFRSSELMLPGGPGRSVQTV